MNRSHAATHCYTRSFSRALFAALPALVALGCNGQGKGQTPPLVAIASPEPSAASGLLAPPLARLPEGGPAPDVTLTLQDGFQMPLSAEKGKLVALYFCSSESNPDCVREARSLKIHWAELRLHHVVTIGVSARDAAAHRAFIAQEQLPFDLASDIDGRIAQAFNVSTVGEYGPYTVLVSRDGKIRKSWRPANPDSRAQEILAVAAE